MGHKDRSYEIEMVMTGNPPAPKPVLKRDGHVIGPDDVIIFNKTTDDMKKVDHYRLRFDIKNFKDSPLRFVPEKRDTMWVQEGTVCPTDFCELPEVIWVDDVDKKGEWIDVINMDMSELRFQFTLNFVDKNITNPTKADYVALDPGGGNQNGGVGGSVVAPSQMDIAAGFFGSAAGGIGAVLATGAAMTAPDLLIAGLIGGVAGLAVVAVIAMLRRGPLRPEPTPAG